MNFIQKLKSIFGLSKNLPGNSVSQKNIETEDVSSLIETFRKISTTPLNEDTFATICDETKKILFTDDFIDLSWNRIAEKYGFYLIEESIDSESRMKLSTPSKSIIYDIKHDRDDILRAYCALSKLVEDEYGVFYCTDSWHSSDLAFIAVPKQYIQSIDTELNEKLISVNEKYEDFMGRAFIDKYQKDYT